MTILLWLVCWLVGVLAVEGMVRIFYKIRDHIEPIKTIEIHTDQNNRVEHEIHITEWK